ncbi:hypothetical protein [Agrobacterium rosae]|uniref:Uncharacterized protein n=1 Tax=Agrobacterium rosae TaxID=1972867 RepID=A0AAW9FSW4_9HYPH|nr:hypothetical protein [Agrobacterium rosae]MDX8305619.1 hypothetical protein [Agrobacterium rosae]
MNMHIDTPQPARRRPKAAGAKQVSAQSMIQMAVDRHSEKTSAVEALLHMAGSNTTLRNHLIQLGAKAAVGERIRSDNAKIFQDCPDANVAAARPLVMKEPQLVSSAHRTRIIKTAATLQLMAVTLPNGVRMANARKADIENAVAVYQPQAQDMLHKAAYYRAVAAKLPDGKRVDEVFNNVTLTSIYEQARVSA